MKEDCLPLRLKELALGQGPGLLPGSCPALGYS